MYLCNFVLFSANIEKLEQERLEKEAKGEIAEQNEESEKPMVSVAFTIRAFNVLRDFVS